MLKRGENGMRVFAQECRIGGGTDKLTQSEGPEGDYKKATV